MKRNLFNRLTAMCVASLLTVASVTAQDNVVLRYTFDNVSGTSVPDASASGVTAKLMNSAKVETMGKYNVLNLGTSSGYLDMTAAAGTVVKDLTDYTVSVYYRVNTDASLGGAGYFLWAFSVSSANTANASAYSGYRLNAQRFATSPGGYAHEAGIEKGGEAAKGVWQNVVYRQKGTKGELFLDGTLVGTNASVPTYQTVFTTAPAYNWIGRAPFTSDAYLGGTLVTDFCVFNNAVSDEEIASLAAVCSDLEHEYRYGTPGDMNILKAKKEECEQMITQAQKEDYPQGAIDLLQDQINIAAEYIALGSLSQVIIDEVCATMDGAMANLKAAKGKLPWEASDFEAGDRGFIHPGGLHTQEDFDRVKRLLAEGDPTITAAWNVLKANEYSGSSIATWPVYEIIRGGGSGQNYMNICRGAAMAYQNALRWKIEGTEANAKAAVRILMAWADVCRIVGGDTNKSLAAGIYGYQLAQAAEMMRDYEGWSREDFARFKRWILEVWYPGVIDFQRLRHDTWANWNGQGGGRPGHYWSNWGLCNALALMNIGILCDDVHIYNQGLSFYKYDQVGTWATNQGNPIFNYGLNEFLGNLIPAVHDDERGPYGKLGQMQESGRDQGHALMALGLAADICQVAWNQGDDLYSYMDNRFAAGAEFVAAYNHSGIEDLPWTEYRYADCRTAWHNTWNMTVINGGGRGGWRPFWDRIVGHYEGVKGVEMKYSKKAALDVRGTAGSDGGGHNYGETSGGYDHLGFTTLMCYNPNPVAAGMAPIVLSPKIEYNGKTYNQAELGGLVNTFENNAPTDIPAGSVVRLMPQLPEGETGTGTWLWDTGETTKDIEVTVNKSRLYRVTYTDERGVKSRQVYSISVLGDCNPDRIYFDTTVDGELSSDTIVYAIYGEPVRLNTWSSAGWSTYRWSTGEETNAITIPNVTFDRTVSVSLRNQGGNVAVRNFHIKVQALSQSIFVDGEKAANSREVIVEPGQDIVLAVTPSQVKEGGTYLWNTGDTTSELVIDSILTSGTYTADYTFGGEIFTAKFQINVPEKKERKLEAGNYLIRHRTTDTYLTNMGDGTANLAPKTSADSYDAAQVWYLSCSGLARYDFVSMLDSTCLAKDGVLKAKTYRPFRIPGAEGAMFFAIRNTGSEGNVFWTVNADGTLNYAGAENYTEFAFEIIPAPDFVPTSIRDIESSASIVRIEYFGIDGTRIAAPDRGIVIRRCYLSDGTVKVEKMFY